jgi:hypothetical protein
MEFRIGGIVPSFRDFALASVDHPVDVCLAEIEVLQ